MKKIFKQSMALFLVLALVFGTLAPVVAWAESETPKVETPVTEGNAPEETPPAEEKQEAAPENAEAPAPENAESEENAAPAQENETEAPADELEISPEEEQTAVGEGEPIEIKSFDDLKPYLTKKRINKPQVDGVYSDRLALKGGNYVVTQDFTINLSDPFFEGKEDRIQYGIISGDEPFTFEGGEKTITVKPADSSGPSVALFGTVHTTEFKIEKLTVEYPGDVSGFGFAQNLVTKDKETGVATSQGLVKNVNVRVGGNVLPLVAVDHDGDYKDFLNSNYTGQIATGFSWYLRGMDIEGLTIDVHGNIGSNQRPESDADMVSAYGLTHAYQNVGYRKDYNGETWDALHNRNHPSILKDAGHITDLIIHVGGNIQAYGKNTGYAAGVGHYMAEAWMERVSVTVDGDIITNLAESTTPIGPSYAFPFALGISKALMNFTDSSLKVNNIVFEGKNLSRSSEYAMVGALGYTNSIGNYTNISGNTITVQREMKGNSDQKLLSSIGFLNQWNTNKDRGVNWVHENAGNTYSIGSIELKGDKEISFYSLGEKWRTGEGPIGSLTLPEASLQGNEVTVGDVKIQSNGEVDVSLLMRNFSNAKKNNLEYGNVSVEAAVVEFAGMGHLMNQKPVKNYYDNVAEDNHLTMGNLTIDAKDARGISLLAGFQDKNQPMKNCTAKVGKVKITQNNSKASSIGGMAITAYDKIEDCRIFADSVKVKDTGSGDLYFGLGSAYASGATIQNSGVFVDGNIELAGQRLYGGGFLGFVANSSTITNNDFQMDGKNNIEMKKGAYGGFAGWMTESTLDGNSSLLLNDFAPFVGFAKGGSINRAAHYVNGKAPQYFSGLIAGGRKGDLPKLTNSTLLVEKAFEDTILYRKDSVTNDSMDNYLVVVDTEDEFNRKAYKVAETNSTDGEMEGAIPVFKKTGAPIAKINIAKRSFQDQYWTAEVVDDYPITNAEESFEYMTASEAGKIEEFGVDSATILPNGVAEGTLKDYDYRHAGLRSESGIALDLLGIKGSKKGNEENPGTPPASTSVIVIVDPNGGMFSDGTTDRKTYTVKIGDTFVLPAAPTREGYKFIAWKAKDGTLYQPGDEYTVKRNGEVFTAQWEEEKKVEPTPAPIPKPQVPPHIAIPVIPKAGVGK